MRHHNPLPILIASLLLLLGLTGCHGYTTIRYRHHKPRRVVVHHHRPVVHHRVEEVYIPVAAPRRHHVYHELRTE